MTKIKLVFISGSIALLLLSGCTFAPRPDAGEAAGVDAAGAGIGVKSSNNATLALLNTARAQTQSGNLEAAAAIIERALRIEPKNPGLWHQLARIRFEQGQYKIAINLASKSSSLAAKDSEIIIKNRQLIENSRYK